MYFRLRKDTEAWFNEVSSYFSTKFDMYYFCAVVGFASGHKSPLEGSRATDLVDTFPREFREKGRVLTGALINAELKARGIETNDRDDVHRLLGRLLSHQTPSRLSEEGMRLVNEYCSGGFEELSASFGDKPRSLSSFLVMFPKIVRSYRNEASS